MSIHFAKETFAPPALRSQRDFFDLNAKKLARNIVAFNPTIGLLKHMLGKFAETVQPSASFDTLRRVYDANPDTVVAFARGTRVESEDGAPPMGMLCQLPLNRQGARALFDGRLNTLEPQSEFLAPQEERPAALYFWCIYMEPGARGGVALAIDRMTSNRYRGVPCYCKSASQDQHRLFLNMGWIDGATLFEPTGNVSSDKLMQYLPSAMRKDRPTYDSYEPNLGIPGRLSVTVARSSEDVMKAMAIRGAAYLEGRFLPLEEDQDGNDFCATHLIGYVGDEAAGCLRIRSFNEFVKFERLAVLSPHRRGRLSLKLIRAGIDFIQAKGYSHIYGQAASHALPIWKYFGFTKRPGPGIEYLTDEEYFEIDLHLDAPKARISPYSGAAILVRPEGQWHRKGPLEKAQEEATS